MINKKEMGQNIPNKKIKYIIFIGGFILGLMNGMALILKYNGFS